MSWFRRQKPLARTVGIESLMFDPEIMAMAEVVGSETYWARWYRYADLYGHQDAIERMKHSASMLTEFDARSGPLEES